MKSTTLNEQEMQVFIKKTRIKKSLHWKQIKNNEKSSVEKKDKSKTRKKYRLKKKTAIKKLIANDPALSQQLKVSLIFVDDFRSILYIN